MEKGGPVDNFLGLGAKLSFFGTSGSHFLTIERVMKKLLKQQADLEKEVRRAKRRKKKENISDDTALSMFTVRKLHVDVKLDLLRNIQDACEKQLVVEADQRREQDRLHMEKQREIHRNGLDPSLVKEAALDRGIMG